MHSLKLFAAAAVIAIGCGLPQDQAEAQPRGRGGRVIEGQVNGPRGASTVRRDVKRGEGRRTTTTEAVGPGGRSRSAQTERTVDREAGTLNRSRTITGPEGGQRTVSDNVQRGEDGAYTFDRTATGRNGQSRTVTGQGQRTQLENGASVSGGFTGPNGEGTFNRTNTVDENGVRTITGSRSNGAGGSSASTTVIDREAGTVNRSGSQTTASGQSRTSEVSSVRTDSGVEVTQTVTGPNGQQRTRTGAFTATPTPPPPPEEADGQ